ncbi:MAG: DNA translocase FtsK [Bacteroidaceae bacterium]|nr:DNA translocase FtsK [Bacteroidaceae bacterium]
MAKSKSTRAPRKKKQEKISFFQAIGLQEIFSNDIINIFAGLILICISALMLASFISYFVTGPNDQSIILQLRPGEWLNTDQQFTNLVGSFGAFTSHFFVSKCFGLGAFCIPIMLALLGLRMMKVYEVNLIKIFFIFTFIMIWLSVFFSACFTSFWGEVFEDAIFSPGGDHGESIKQSIENIIGFPGLLAILIITALGFLTYLSRETIRYMQMVLNPTLYYNKARNILTVSTGSKGNGENEYSEDYGGEDEVDDYDEPLPDPTTFDNPETQSVAFKVNGEPTTAPTFIVNPTSEAEAADEIDNSNATLNIQEGVEEEAAKGNSVAEKQDLSIPINHKAPFEKYKYPVLDLLQQYEDDGKPYINMEEQQANSNRIIEVLNDFGVEVRSINATVGPTITLYEITLGPGVRISKIRNLSDDLALSLHALGVRIIAPMPGKGTVGIEVPNKKKNIVSMVSILNSKKFQETKMALPLALGKTITNEVFMVDLAKLPHLLVAGATGQGKSVGLNAIITSLLYKKHPNELKFVLVDPKKVEFSVYQTIQNHFMAKLEEEDDAIITDVKKVVKTLNSLCKLMDTRYDLLKMASCRNIKEYNEKFLNHKLRLVDGHDYMPYVVVIIDEFGDLIMTAGKEVELPIARIAQLARAVGIHMVIATQRPTTTIITGNIKANFPGRMAFRTSQSNDSKIILDRPGANQLIGRGDMLILDGADPVRVQCAFVDTPEIEKIAEFISSQPGPIEPLELPEPPMEEGEGGAASVDISNLDPLFDQAAQSVVSSGQGSTSMIQRQFSIGYNRAGRLMDQLEKCGIVGPAKGSKPREVLITDIMQLDAMLQSMHSNTNVIQ